MSRAMRGLKPYLQLVRLPNLFTAAADPLAGWLLVGGSIGDARGWGPLVASGVAAYAAGMVLNDVFDYEVDRAERPGRPLPSGRASRRLAAVAGIILLVASPLLAAVAGGRSAEVALALAAAVLGYDAGLKRTPLGPEVMGACRSLNLLLGMSTDPSLGGPAGWVAAGAFGLFVAGITWISRDEAREGLEPWRARGVLAGLALEQLALLGLLVAASGGLPSPSSSSTFGQGGPIGLAAGLVVLGLVAWVVDRKGLRALREPAPATLQAAVKAGVLGLVWLDVALVAAARGPAVALAVSGLWLPAFWLGRWLYST